MNRQNEDVPKKAIGIKQFTSELLSEMVNLDRGVPGTFVSLFTRPAEVVEDYFSEADRYMSPFRYTLFVASVVTLLLATLLDFEQLFMSAVEAAETPSTKALPEGFQEYLGLVQQTGLQMVTKYLPLTYIFLVTPSFALSSYLLFKKRKSYFSQHIILNMYCAAQFGSLAIITVPLMAYTQSMLITSYFSYPLMIAYLIWVYTRYFALETVGKWLRAFISFLLGYLFFFIAMALTQYSIAAIRYFW